MSTDYHILLTALIRIVNEEQSLGLLTRISIAARYIFPDGEYTNKEADIADRIYESNKSSSEEERVLLYQEYKQALVEFLQTKKNG